MRIFFKTVLFCIASLLVFSAAKATTVDDILKQIAVLQQQIAQLQAQLAVLQPSVPQNTSAVFSFVKDLKLQDESDDVFYLQRVLKKDGAYCAKCYVTGYFGTGTKNALQAFQKKYGLNVTGIADNATRIKLNQILPQIIPASTSVPTQASVPTPAPVPLQSFPNASTGTTSVPSPVNDTIPPSFSITINGGAQSTTKSEVTVWADCKDPSGGEAVRFSNVPAFTNEPWGGVTAGKQWILSSGDEVKTVYAECKDAAGNIATASDTISLNALPPVISNVSPAGALAANTAQATLSFVTDEQATCKYSTTQGVDYDAMPNGNTFASTNSGSSHSIAVSTPSAGAYSFYVRCEDVAGNKDTIDRTITFTVASAVRTSAPVRSNGLPSGVLPAGTSQTAISLSTDEPATCKYATVPGIAYDAMANTFFTTSSTSHSVLITGLLNGGQYAYYVKCSDNFSNTNSGDFSISFRVQNPTYAMNVLVLKYFPLTADGKNIDINVTGDVGDLYTTILQRTIDVTNNLMAAIQRASTYLGYKDASAQPSFNYTIADTKTTNSAVPTKNTPVLRYPDYFQILSDLKICDYVTQQNVNEVWFFAYQGPTKADGAPYLNIAESKMAGPNGDISNSYRYNNMPACSKTYRVYTFNYGRGTSEAMESWGHQMEAELGAVNDTLFRNYFQGVNYPQTLGVPGRCGSVHNPPNARSEYDRANPTPQQSDCLDWNPDTLGPALPISCQNWGCQDVSDSNSASLNYMIWNWQNLPGANNIKTYQSKHLRNWWDVHGDFDNVLANSRRLTIEP